MAGTIFEFFGYPANDKSEIARWAAENGMCPFLNAPCQKELRRDSNATEPLRAGACTIKQVTSAPVICCPIRLYAGNYQVLSDVSRIAFGSELPLYSGKHARLKALETKRKTVAVFGKGWGGELRLPQRDGIGAYFVDWILALINPNGVLDQFVAVEVQTIDTTGNYRNSRAALLTEKREIVQSSVGLNHENVNKRIIPQLIYKGNVLSREKLCTKGLFFVSPTSVFERIMKRLGNNLPAWPIQPSTITFLPYELSEELPTPGNIIPLIANPSFTTQVFRVQEAFSNFALPTENVYQNAIETALNVS